MQQYRRFHRYTTLIQNFKFSFSAQPASTKKTYMSTHIFDILILILNLFNTHCMYTTTQLSAREAVTTSTANFSRPLTHNTNYVPV